MTTSAIDSIGIDESTQTDIPLTEHEVTEVIESIKSASDPILLHGSHIFDSTAMAPLSPTSAVSQSNCH